MIAEVFAEAVERHGEHPFLVSADEALTWKEAGALVGRTAAWLSEEGVRPGDRVALLMSNEVSYFVLLLAIAQAGAVVVPLSTSSTSERLEAILGDAGVSLVIAGRGQGWSGPGPQTRWLRVESLTELGLRVAGLPAHRVERAKGEDAFLVYTSGTTGRPKGVVLPEAAFPTAGRLLAEVAGLERSDRVAVALPLFHTNPVVYGLMVALSTGCSVAVLERFSASRMLAQASALGATGFTYVGTVLTLLARNPPPPAESTLRFALGGGAPTAAWEQMQQWGIEVLELYGMTETGGWLTSSRRGEARPGYCGTARPDVEVLVRRPTGETCAPEEVGEIVARPHDASLMMSSYRGLPELTAQRWRDGWFHTGDRGALSADGFLRYADRLDGIIRRGGENIDPQGVVEVVEELPAVRQAAVVGVPDDVVGQELRLVVVGEHVSVPELVHHLQNRLPKAAWPRYVALTDTLPLTDTQKIDLGALRVLGTSDIDLARERRRSGGAE